MDSNEWNEVMVAVQEAKYQSLSCCCIPKSVLRTCEETLWFFCNSLAKFLLLPLSFWNDGRVTSGSILWLNVAKAKRRWIFNLLLESPRIISIKHKRHVSSDRHSSAWLRCVSVINSLSRILMLCNSSCFECILYKHENKNHERFEKETILFPPKSVI